MCTIGVIFTNVLCVSVPLVGRTSPSVDGGNMDGNGMMGMMPNMMGGPMGYGPMMGTMSGDPNMMMMGPMGNMGFNQVKSLQFIHHHNCSLLAVEETF